MKPVYFKFKVLGKSWILRLYNRRKYSRKNGKDSVAITKFHVRRIDLSPKGVDLESITHELVHAYLYELCLHSSNLRKRDLEEVFCELMAKRGMELLCLADQLYERIHD